MRQIEELPVGTHVAEVVVMFEESVLRVHHLHAGQRFYVGASTAAALSAKSSCRGFPAAASRNIAITIPPAMTTRAADMGKLTVPIRQMAETVAIQGGRTFQINMFSTEKIAFDVAVMRLVSIPGKRSEK